MSPDRVAGGSDRKPAVLHFPLDAHLDALAAAQDAERVSWGFDSLDRLAPWPCGSMSMVVGPTGSGKTSLALAVAAKHALETGPVLYAHLELTGAQLLAKLAAQSLPYSALEILQAGKELHDRVAREVVAPLGRFYTMRAAAMGSATYALERIRERHDGPILYVIDYVQLIQRAGAKSEREAVTATSNGIVNFTEEQQIATLVVSRASRNSSRRMRENEESADSFVDVAAESSALEYGATNVLALAGRSTDAEERDMTVHVAKARYAMGGSAYFTFAGRSGRWAPSDGPPKAPDLGEIILEQAGDRIWPTRLDLIDHLRVEVKGVPVRQLRAALAELIERGALLEMDKMIRRA